MDAASPTLYPQHFCVLGPELGPWWASRKNVNNFSVLDRHCKDAPSAISCPPVY